MPISSITSDAQTMSALRRTLSLAAAKQVVDSLNNAIRSCKQASDPSQAPNFAKQATETAKWINEFIKTNAIRRENWVNTIQPLIDQLKAEKLRMEGLIKGAQPRASTP